jgi:hypothetical protein
MAWIFQNRPYAALLCKSNIEMTLLCNIEVTLRRVVGSRGVHRDAVVDEQATRTRSLAFIGKEFDQLFFSHPLRDATLADAIADALNRPR